MEKLLFSVLEFLLLKNNGFISMNSFENQNTILKYNRVLKLASYFF